MDVTHYVALPFVLADDGLALGEAVERHRHRYAGRGALAEDRLRRRTRVQPAASGEFGDAKVIRKDGDCPRT